MWVLIPKALHSSTEFRGTDDFGGIARGEREATEVGGEGDSDRDVICDVVTSFIMIREGMNILVW